MLEWEKLQDFMIEICISASQGNKKKQNIEKYMKNLFYFWHGIEVRIFNLSNEIGHYIELDNKKNKYYIIFLTQERDNVWSLILKLRKKKIYNFYVLTDEDYENLLKNYTKMYLEKKGYNCGGDILRFGNYIMINPFKYGAYKLCFGDLVMPCIFNDFTMVDEGPYEYLGVKLQEGDVVVDCGAHIGAFTLYALSKGCVVHAFEPIKKTYKKLLENIKFYDSSKIVTNNMGLFNTSGVANFYIHKEGHDSRNSMMFNDMHIDYETCEIVSLDEYISENDIERVDFIKADIEGAERFMLMGAKKTIQRFKPKISICTYHYEDDPTVLKELISDICKEYQIVEKWKKIFAFVPHLKS